LNNFEKIVRTKKRSDDEDKSAKDARKQRKAARAAKRNYQ